MCITLLITKLILGQLGLGWVCCRAAVVVSMFSCLRAMIIVRRGVAASQVIPVRIIDILAGCAVARYIFSGLACATALVPA